MNRKTPSILHVPGCLRRNAALLSLFLLSASAPSCSGDIGLNTLPESQNSAGIYATKGLFKDKILISWAEAPSASAYIIYRSSDGKDGEFLPVAEIEAGSAEADIQNSTYIKTDESENSETDTDASADEQATDDNEDNTSADPEVPEVVFTSDVDLSGDGVYVTVWQTASIGINFEDTSLTVSFSDGKWFDMNKYNQSEVVDAINSAAGKEVCTASGESFVDIKSSGVICLTNESSLSLSSNSPIGLLLYKGTAQEEVVIINSEGVQKIGSDDYTGNPSDYRIKDEDSEIPEDEPDETESDDDSEENQPAVYPFGETSSMYIEDREIDVGPDYFYRVRAITAEGYETLLTDTVSGYASDGPTAPGGISASRGSSPNSVTVTWDPVSGAEYYQVLRAPYGSSDYSIAGEEIIPPESTDASELSFTDESVPPGIFIYLAIPYGEGDSKGISSSTTWGYRNISDLEFILEYQKEILNSQEKWEAMLGFEMDSTQSLGANVTADGIVSGTANYKVVMDGLGGIGTCSYSDYCDYYFHLMGSNATNSNMSKNGDLAGVIEAAAIYTDSQGSEYTVYQGTVRYDIEIKSAKPAGGYYYVSQNGGEETAISWELVPCK